MLFQFRVSENTIQINKRFLSSTVHDHMTSHHQNGTIADSLANKKKKKKRRHRWVERTASFSHLSKIPGAVAESVEREPQVQENCSFISHLRQSNDVQNWYLSLPSLVLGLIGKGKDCLAQCQDNVTEWDIGSYVLASDFPMRQHYRIIMSAHCHVLVPVPIWP